MPLRLTSVEQSALAELCCLCASIKRHMQQNNEFATEAHIDELNHIVERRQSMNWSDLYDKLHRSGANF